MVPRIYPSAVPALATFVLLAVLLVAPPADGSTGKTVAAEVKRADGLMADGKVDEALALFSALHREHPKRPDVIFRLEGALAKSGRYEAARDLMVTYLKRAPHDATAHFRLGDSLYRLGNREEAFKNWNWLLRDATQEGPYAIVAQRYRSHNLQAEAEAIYRRGREALKTPWAFARELAELAEADGRFSDAVDEYVTYLDRKPRHLTLIESRVKQFAGLVDDHEPVLRRLSDAVRQQPESQTRLRLLTGYATAAGRPDSAIAVLGHLQNRTTTVRVLLSRLGSQSLRAGRYASARDAYALLLQSPGESDPNAFTYLLGLANANRGMGLTDKAARLYARVSTEAGASTTADEATYKLGELHVAEYGNDDEGLAILSGLAESRRRSSWRDRALLQIGEIQLRKGRLDLAVQACGSLQRGARDREAADLALYRIAEYQFLGGDIPAARKTLDGAMAGSTTRNILNDVLDLSLLIDLGKQDTDAVLKRFARARRLMRQDRPDEAIRALERFLADHPGSHIADYAAADRIRLLIGMARYPEAAQACRALTASPTVSTFQPWAQLKLGEIHEDRLGQLYEARTAYQSVLARYPDSLEADVARERLRNLADRIQDLEATRKEPG